MPARRRALDAGSFGVHANKACMAAGTDRVRTARFRYLSGRGQHMRTMNKAKVGLGTLGALTLMVALFAPAASADYAPGSGDIVGVGSDTVQAAGDFVADGDYQADAGYNSAGNL